MAIQECYYFNVIGVNYFLFSFFRYFFRCHIYFFIFNVGYWFLLLTLDISFLSYLKKDKKLNK